MRRSVDLLEKRLLVALPWDESREEGFRVRFVCQRNAYSMLVCRYPRFRGEQLADLYTHFLEYEGAPSRQRSRFFTVIRAGKMALSCAPCDARPPRFSCFRTSPEHVQALRR